MVKVQLTKGQRGYTLFSDETTKGMLEA